MARILVIDDSAFLRTYLRGHLEEAGFEVEEWLPLSGLEILERVRNSALDLVLSDYNMPHVDGLTVVKMAKRANSLLPVVILTAVRDHEREERLLNAGASRVLNKPITPEDLVRNVNEVLAEVQNRGA